MYMLRLYNIFKAKYLFLLVAFASKVRDICFETLLVMSTSAAHEKLQLTCTKGALMVIIKSRLIFLDYCILDCSFYYIIDRFLIPQINDQVTEPLIETINTLSGLILPIMMTQTIVRANKKESRRIKATFSSHSNGNVNSNQEDQEIADSPVLNVDNLDEEETDEGEMDKMLRTNDYIDVSEQGTISNASRLDRVLKDRERAKYKKNKKSNTELIDAMTRDDVSYLFDPDMSNTERESLFLKFEVPVSARNQISGALTALFVLIGNDQITNSIITGDTYRNPILNVLDDIVFDIDDIDNSIYSLGRTKNRNGLPSTFGNIKNNLIPSSITSETARLILPERIRTLIQHLVYMTLYPTLGEWAAKNSHNYPVNTLVESKATEIYADVIKWICTFSKSPEYSQVYVNSSNTSDKGKRMSGSLDEFGPSDNGREKEMLYFKSIQTTDDNEYSARSQHRISRDSSSDSEDDYDSEDDSESVSIYPMRSKKIVSTEETRRKSVNSNGVDILSVTSTSEYYLGFSSRALVLLNSLLRNGMY